MFFKRGDIINYGPIDLAVLHFNGIYVSIVGDVNKCVSQKETTLSCFKLNTIIIQITCSAKGTGMLVKTVLTSNETKVSYFGFIEMFDFLDEICTIFNKG